MANEVVMSPVYRGVVEAAGYFENRRQAFAEIAEEAPHVSSDYDPSQFDFVLSSLHAIREAAEDRVDAMIRGRQPLDINVLFEPTSVEFDPTEVVGVA